MAEYVMDVWSERGRCAIDVRDEATEQNSVFSAVDSEVTELIELGYIAHIEDSEGLQDWLIETGILNPDDEIVHVS